jgi:hypothetical protein
MRRTKPSVKLKCVANSYASPNERIIEISGRDGEGALISVRNCDDDGKVLISVYRVDPKVIVGVAPRDDMSSPLLTD